MNTLTNIQKNQLHELGKHLMQLDLILELELQEMQHFLTNRYNKLTATVDEIIRLSENMHDINPEEHLSTRTTDLISCAYLLQSTIPGLKKYTTNTRKGK